MGYDGEGFIVLDLFVVFPETVPNEELYAYNTKCSYSCVKEGLVKIKLLDVNICSEATSL